MRSTGAVSSVLALVAVAFSASSARATITFQAGVPIDLSDDPPADGIQAIAVADLNHDGKADLIVVHQATGDISVFLNSGSGAFNSPIVLSSDLSPIAVTTGDFDNDGNVDMAVVNDDDTVTTYLGDGAGNFDDSRNYDVCGGDFGAVGVVAARLDDDLYDDLAVLCDGSVHLLRSVGDGTFSPFGTPSIDTLGYGNFAIAAGRINSSHNYVDLAISSAFTDSVSVFFGNNDGTFQSPFVIQSGNPILSNPQGLAIGEFDGDNAPDIAVIGGVEVDTTVLILGGDGAGGFTVSDTRGTSSAEIGSVAIVAMDLDGDRKTDLAVSSADSDYGLIALFCQQPSSVCNDGVNTIAAGFQIQGVLRALSGPVTALQSGDLNGDGRPDLVGLNSDSGMIKILINTTGEASPTPTQTPTPTPTPTRTPRPTFTPTPTPPPMVYINVGSARGGPGDTVTIAVSLQASGAEVAATASDISFDRGILNLDPSDCQVNPMIDKWLVASVLWDSAWAKEMRFFVRSNRDAAPIPDGVLYTCTVHIAPSAWPGSYLLGNSGPTAFGPDGQPLQTQGWTGMVTVSLVPVNCVGDCGTDGSVTVGDILEMVNVALGNRPMAACQAGDADGDGAISVDEILTAVSHALNGCP
jgi:hypothetical protein